MTALREVCVRENVPDCIVLVIKEYCDTYNVLEKRTRLNEIIRMGYVVWKERAYLDGWRTTEYEMKCHIWTPYSASLRYLMNTEVTCCVDHFQWYEFIESFTRVEAKKFRFGF